jgi:hypothetical protein
MKNNMALKQFSYCNVQFFVTAIAYNTWFNFTKSTNASDTSRAVMQGIELVEVEVQMEVQLTVTVPQKCNHEYKSKKPQKKSRKKQSQKKNCPHHREQRFK